MEAKDVKVGMKVILNANARRCDGSNTLPDESAEWGGRGKEQGFLFVVGPRTSVNNKPCFSLGADEKRNNGDWYYASDFSPATIEVGDTVRVRDDLVVDAVYGGVTLLKSMSYHLGATVTVSDVGTDGAGVRYARFNEIGYGWSHDMLTLIRKARKPEQKTRDDAMDSLAYALKYTFEQKKEATPVSKKPRLEDINERTLVKLRSGRIGAVLKKADGFSIYDRDYFTSGTGGGGICAPRFNDGDAYDIVATKQYGYAIEVIRAVLTNTEPAWDWTEDMDKPEFKRPTIGDSVEMLKSVYKYPVGTKHTITFDDHCDEHGTGSMPYKLDGDFYWIRADQVKHCPPPAPVEITEEELLRQYDKGAGVKLVFKGQSIEVK